jgi:hypothetical protein
MKRLTVAALATLFLSAGAQTAPRAESALECGIAADMAVVAHSLAHEDVQRPKASQIMARIYDVAESARGKEIMKEILEAAYAGSGGSGHKFAEDLFAACMKSGGNLDTVLGKRL